MSREPGNVSPRPAELDENSSLTWLGISPWVGAGATDASVPCATTASQADRCFLHCVHNPVCFQALAALCLTNARTVQFALDLISLLLYLKAIKAVSMRACVCVFFHVCAGACTCVGGWIRVCARVWMCMACVCVCVMWVGAFAVRR